MPKHNVIARDAWGTVEWAVDAGGRYPAEEFFLDLSENCQAEFLALCKRLARDGKIVNWQKFHRLGSRAGKYAYLWELKPWQVRFLGDFRPGRRFLVAHGCPKKKDALRTEDMAIANRVLAENDGQKASS